MSLTNNGIAVSGTGEAAAPPDLISIGIGISTLEKTVADANRAAADAARRLLESLRASGIADRDIATTQYTIASEYDWSNNTRRLLGYRVNNTLNVKIRDLPNAGATLDRAVQAAGDAVTVNNFQYLIENPTELEKKARQAAWESARDVAEQLATLAGRPLGRPSRIVETQEFAVPTPKRMAAEATVASTPFESGTTTVSVTVSVDFDFAD